MYYMSYLLLLTEINQTPDSLPCQIDIGYKFMRPRDPNYQNLRLRDSLNSREPEIPDANFCQDFQDAQFFLQTNKLYESANEINPYDV